MNITYSECWEVGHEMGCIEMRM